MKRRSKKRRRRGKKNGGRNLHFRKSKKPKDKNRKSHQTIVYIFYMEAFKMQGNVVMQHPLSANSVTATVAYIQTSLVKYFFECITPSAIFTPHFFEIFF